MKTRQKMTRSEIAAALKQAAVSYYLRKRYSCFLELGLNSWGKLRGDVVCVNLKRDLVVVEVKSCYQDWASDSKHTAYLDYCHRMYVVAPEKTALRIARELKADKSPCGVMCLDPTTGYLRVVRASKRRELKPDVVLNLITRMAWRNGTSRRNSRRTRQFLE